MATVEFVQGPETAASYGRMVASSRFLKRRAITAKIVSFILFLAAALSVFITAAIIYILVYDFILFFREVSIFDFLTDTEWTPVFENPKFGIITLVSGTLMTTFIGLLVAIPAGTILSIYLSEFASYRVREIIKPVLELLAGVPTVAFGYFALFFLTPIFQIFIPNLSGFNLLVPGIVIGIMILPYIVSVAEDAMRAVPDSLREGAFALGFTRFQTATRVVIPGAFSGVAARIFSACRVQSAKPWWSPSPPANRRGSPLTHSKAPRLSPPISYRSVSATCRTIHSPISRSLSPVLRSS